MSKTLIYIIAAFALWLYFKFGNFGREGQSFNSGREDGGNRQGGTFGNTPQLGGQGPTYTGSAGGGKVTANPFMEVRV